MDRWELIMELRRHAHPSWYKRLILNPTVALRALLMWYESPEDERGSISLTGICIIH